MPIPGRLKIYGGGTWNYTGYGQSGYSGLSGYSSYSGISGYSSYSGISGYSGVSGYSGTPPTGTVLYADTRFKVGVFTYSYVAGTYAVTSLGFVPKAIIFFGTSGTYSSYGADDGTTHSCNYQWYNGNHNSGTSQSTTFSLEVFTAMDVAACAYVSTLGTDGFTLTWSNGGGQNPSGNIYVTYIAYR